MDDELERDIDAGDAARIGERLAASADPGAFMRRLGREVPARNPALIRRLWGAVMPHVWSLAPDHLAPALRAIGDWLATAPAMRPTHLEGLIALLADQRTAELDGSSRVIGDEALHALERLALQGPGSWTLLEQTLNQRRPPPGPATSRRERLYAVIATARARARASGRDD